MNEKQKAYILSNYDKYGLFDESKIPITRDDMLALLNILESNDVTLDELHDVAFNGLDEFCGIFGSYENDSDTYNALLSHHLFLTDSEFIDYALEKVQELKNDGEDVAKYFAMFIDDSIAKTSDGYVIRFDY